MSLLRNRFRLWFSFDLPVDRQTYFLNGLGLMALKYAVDSALLWRFTGRVWSPWIYFNPLWKVREQLMSAGPAWLAPLLVVVALPFLWIGVSMSARRAVDAGLSAWLALLFFIPVVNLVLMAVLSLLPSRPRTAAPAVDERFQSAMLGVAFIVADTIVVILIAVYFRHQYSAGLFLGLPFMLGFLAGNIFGRRFPGSAGGTVGLALAAVTVAAGAVVVFALEGLGCILMALPLAWAIAVPGALLGRALARGEMSPTPGVGTAALLIPLLFAVEPRAVPGSREVVSVVEISAAPAEVWRHVVTFPRLDAPTEWVFRMGLAAPIGARIEGSGVGAVRYCDFTTGSFREPIRVWEEGSRLAFDITEQAPPMRELSPYGDIRAPHLDGYFRATHGEFELIPLEGGRTRLIGRTRYVIDMFPQVYWTIFADQIVEAIHGRVLRHIKGLAEPAAFY